MKSAHPMLFATSLLICGCDGSGDALTKVDTGSDVTMEDVKRETVEALDVASDVAGQARNDFVEAFSDQMTELNEQIAELETQAAKASADLQVKYKDEIAMLHEKRDAAAIKFNQLKGSSADQWKELRASLTAAWRDVKRSTDEVTESLGSDESVLSP